MKRNTKELVSYMLAGACSTTIDISCFMACMHYWRLSMYSALMLSFSVGVFCNFLICNLFIFKRSTSLLRAMGAHYSTNVSALIFQNIGLSILQNTPFFEHVVIARLFISSITFLFNFFLIKHFAFNSLQNTSIKNISDIQNTI